MPEANPVFEPGLKAENDLTAAANRYRGVEISAANQVDICDAQGELCIGVLHNNPNAGQAAQVQIGGTTPAKGGGSISAGAKVMVDADGDFITFTTQHHCVGVAKTACGGDGQIFDLILMPIGLDEVT